MANVLVTGGAGFIGSWLVERLVEDGHTVTVLDNLSYGSLENLRGVIDKVRFVKGDCTEEDCVKEALDGIDDVFHLSANPEVRVELNDPQTCFRQNVYATYVLLEQARKEGIGKIVYTSSSTVYGEPNVKPTPENYSPLAPISLYGGSKLASEAIMCSYSYMFDIDVAIVRLANVVGARMKHGVVYDFVRKLRTNPRRLEVLGDGKQRKSYLYVKDCVEGIVKIYKCMEKGFSVYNLGSDDWITVSRIAEVVIEEMGLRDVKVDFTGGVEGGRGWKGDVKEMVLDVSKIRLKGWSPKLNSEQAVRASVKDMMGREFAAK